MTAFKRYWRYHAKGRLGYLFTVTLLGVLITLVTLLDEQSDGINEKTYSLFYMPAIVLSVLAVLTALLEFKPFLTRRNLDTLYSLPISRRAMLTVHWITGLATTLIAHAASFWLVFLFWLPHREFFALSYAVPLYFLSIVCGAVMYSFTVFFFTRGNTFADGCLIVALAVFCIPFLALAVKELFDIRSLIPDHLYFWSPINDITTHYQNIIEVNNKYALTHNFWSKGTTLAACLTYLVFGIATGVAFFLTYHKKRVEVVGEITTSWFGYRTLIPLCGFSLFTLMNDLGFWLAVVGVLMVTGYVIYRRSYRLKPSDLVILGIFLCYASICLIV